MTSSQITTPNKPETDAAPESKTRDSKTLLYIILVIVVWIVGFIVMQFMKYVHAFSVL